jgi:hypothetical protein
MPRHKVLKSVAHNIGHSFTSLMNFVDDDYVMGHILRFARQSGHETLTIDFVTNEVKPPELVADPISEVPARYIKWFWDSVDRQGSDRSYVQAARLTLRFDIATQRPHSSLPGCMESPYHCDVTVTDDRGKRYDAHFEGWWYPERLGEIASEARPWWKFWSRKPALRNGGAKFAP